MGTLPVRPQTIALINQALRGMVNEKGGTGYLFLTGGNEAL